MTTHPLRLPAPTSAERPEVPCPWCGDPQCDLWEYHSEGDHEIECAACGRSLLLTVERTVTYTLRTLGEVEP